MNFRAQTRIQMQFLAINTSELSVYWHIFFRHFSIRGHYLTFGIMQFEYFSGFVSICNLFFFRWPTMFLTMSENLSKIDMHKISGV